MPELPEAERARQAIDRVLGRRIVAVDDHDTYVCRPHPPGEIAAALSGQALVSTHRRGKFLWAETADGPVRGRRAARAAQLGPLRPPLRGWRAPRAPRQAAAGPGGARSGPGACRA